MHRQHLWTVYDTVSDFSFNHPNCYMQDLQGQLNLARSQIEDFQKLQQVLDQLQASSAALLSENTVLTDNQGKLQHVAAQALELARTQQVDGANNIDRLNAKHAKELKVYLHATFLTRPHLVFRSFAI